MVKSRGATLILLGFFLVSICAGLGAAPVAAATSLSDISGNWAYAQITHLVNNGVIYGYADGTFKPNDTITRAEFIAMINRAFDLTEIKSVFFYTDVKTGDWFYNDIAKATAAGYISGFLDGSMRPNNMISRQEAAAIMARVMAMDTASSASLPFTDAPAIPDWSRNSIAAMVKAGYISGYPDGTFRPFNAIARAEAASIIYQGMVERMAVTEVTLDESSVYLSIGDNVTLKATIKPADAYNKDLTWSSSDEDVATVSSTGKVTAEGDGTCTIKVTTVDGGFTDTCRVTVAEGAIKEINLNADEVEIMVGGNFRLIPEIDPSNIDYPQLTWKSDKTDVATVSESGFVTALGEDGEVCIITVSSEEDRDIYAECEVRIIVFDPDAVEAVDSITLNEDRIEIEPDGYFQLWAKSAPEDAFNQKIYWETDDSDVATVNSHGLVRGRDEGSCVITAYWENDDSIYAECGVVVALEAEESELRLNNASITLAPGEHDTTKGTLENAVAAIDTVHWVIAYGDNVVDVEIDEFTDYFNATVTADADADDGDECRIIFTVTDVDGNEYEVGCTIKISE